MNLEDTKRIVIKIGSSLLFHEDSNKLNEKWLSSLAEDIGYLNENNKEVIIAETVWSPKLRQLAQAITSGDPSLTPKGIKKTTIESQLKAFNLKDYMGVIMLSLIHI